MFRALLCAVLGMGWVLCAASTKAGEFELSVDARVGGDSNVFRRNTRPKRIDDAEADAFWEFSPRALVRDERDAFRYEASYRPTHTGYFDISGVDGWDHNVNGEASWSITPADTIGAEGSFAQQRRFRLFLEDDPSSVDPDALITQESDRELIRLSSARLNYVRSISPSVLLRTDYAFSDIDFVPNSGSQARQVDSRAHTISAGPTWQIDPLSRLGLTGAFRFRENPGLDGLGQATTRTLTWDLSASVTRELSKTVTLSAAAGPTFIRTEQEVPTRQFIVSGPGGPSIITLPAEQAESSDISFFAAVSLAKRWRTGRAEASYSRYESGSGGAASASIVDQVILRANHRFTEKWSAEASGTWSQRDQIIASGVLPDFRTRLLQAILGARYAFTKRWSAGARLTYQNQIRQQDGFDTRTVEIYVGFVSLRYVFEPLTF